MSNIIAISGFKNSGKDTVADMLQYCLSVPKYFQKYWLYKNYRDVFIDSFKKVAFADALKDTLSVLFNIPVERFYDRDFKEKFYIKGLKTTSCPDKDLVLDDQSFSKMLVEKDYSFLKNNYITIRQLMQCFGTEIVRELFGDSFWAERAMKHTFDKMIITDLRFKTEFDAVKKNGGIVIYVDNPKCKPSNHASESEVLDMDFDFVIKNDGSLGDLFYKIVEFSNTWIHLPQS